MAALQSSSFLSRTRSGRVPGLRTAATTTESVTMASQHQNGISQVSSQVSHTVSHTSHSSLAPSNVSIFLTNLRLLDLDLNPDWPDITARTFATKDAGQGQKRRIQTVEWALYQLFCLWDPEEARSKMQPYFPPADQVQSVNLRATLLRALEQAKKNGTLGRDAIIRKTMLDECRGERLEEVLAVFSSAVLKKVMAEEQLNNGVRRTNSGPGRPAARRKEQHPAAAKSLALENRGYTAERTSLNGLILAHRVSLSRSLRAKETARARYKDFAELLDLKQRSLARRQESALALEEKDQRAREGEGRQEDMADDARLHVRRVVRNNWSGSEQWMEALLCGDGSSSVSSTSTGTNRKDRDGLLSTPYDRVWRRVQAGRLSELEGHGGRGGLLEQMERRTGLQHERLRRWEDYRRNVFRKSASEKTTFRTITTAVRTAKTVKTATTTSAQESKGIDLGFGIHAGLYPAAMSPRKPRVQDPLPIQGDYVQLVERVAVELASVNQPPAGQPSLAAFLQSRTAMTARTATPAGSAAAAAAAAVAAGEGKHGSAEAAAAAADESEVSDISDIDDHAAEGPPVALLTGRESRSPRVGQRMLLSKASMTFSVTTYDSDEESGSPIQQRQQQQQQLLLPRTVSGSLALPSSSAHAAAQQPEAAAAVDLPIRRRQSPPIWPRSPRSPPASKTIVGDGQRRQPLLPRTPPVPEVTVYVPEDSPRSPPPSPPQPSPPEALADQILASMNDASPSPAKTRTRHRLSLAQRTRLSLARTPRGGAAIGMMMTEGAAGSSSFDDMNGYDAYDDYDDYDEPNLNSLPIRRSGTAPVAVVVVSKEEDKDKKDKALPSEEQHEHEDLVARTRRSMAGFEASRQKAQLERRRSQRKSRAPLGAVSASATASSMAHFDAVEEGDSTLILAEELMSGGQDDAEAIFRSRPKIKMSPIPSPVRDRSRGD